MLINHNGQTALIWKDRHISYDTLLRHVHYYSTLFDALQTDKVAIFSENRPEWAFAFYAAWKNDAIAVPIDYMSPPDDVAYILNDCQPEMIFCSRETGETFEKCRASLKYQIRILYFEDLNEQVDRFEPEAFQPTDVNRTAVIIYTSGTTGSPKGVMLSFDNLLANIEAVSHDIPIYTPERKVLALLPLHHIFPLMGTLVAPLYAGGRIAFSPSLNSDDIMATLQNNGINIIIGVPRLYAAIRKGIMDKINAHFVTRTLFRLAALINSQGFSKKLFKKVHARFGGQVEYMVSGGAKLDEAVAQDFKTLGFEMLEGFGMTEAAPMITFTRPGKWRIGSAGQPMPCLEVNSKNGEIIARGRNIMQGYYNRPEEAAAVLKKGWLHTGDLGYLDDEGYIFITGRSKEIIVLSSGKNINPEEVENKISVTSDCIAEVGVYLKDDTLQAAIFPDFKKLNEKGILNLEDYFRWDIIDQYNQKAASYKKISKFLLLKEELPKTRLGKIQRFKLATLSDSVAGKNKQQRAEPDYEEYIVIRDFLKDQGKAPIAPDDHIEIDLGLDSLEKVGLLTFLQSTFGIELKEEVLLHHPTIEKLSEFMKEKKQKISVETIKWAEILKEKVDLHLPKSWFTFNLFKNSSKVFFKLYFRIKGEGTENLPQSPFILAPNHQSFFDGLFISAYLKNRVMKNTYFYAKEKHVRHPFLRSMAHRHNIIVMDINRDLKQSLQKLAEVLRKGKNIVVFPEGTRTRTGKLGELKKSFAILSREMNVPVVPVSIKGAFEALPRGSLIPRPWKKIHIKFHQPVFPEGNDYDSLISRVQEQLVTELG